MTRTCVVTGATGLLGRQVLQQFKFAGWNTIGTGYSRATPPSVLEVDLSDEIAVERLIEQVR